MPTPTGRSSNHLFPQATAVLLRSDEDLFEQSKMSFGQHLDELRVTLWKCLVALLLGSVVGFLIGNRVVQHIQTPLQQALDEFRKEQSKTLTGEDPIQRDGRTFIPIDFYEKTGDGIKQRRFFTPLDQDPRTQAIGTGVTDAFMVYVKASLVVGAVVSSPAIFYFIWQFVASGLYKHERSYVYIYMPFSIGLFLAGASLAFYFAVRIVVDFLFDFYRWLGIMPTPRINEWLSFVLMMPVGFGVAFQLPLVMLFAERIGVVDITRYLQFWKVAVLGIFFLSMILTPADPWSMLLLAIPLTLLYFGGVLLCWLLPPREPSLNEPPG